MSACLSFWGEKIPDTTPTFPAKPLETIYLSHKPHPIKVVDTALSETTKADEIKTAKTGKVTAVGTVMSIFKKKRCKLRSATLGKEIPSHHKAEISDFRGKYPRIKKPTSKNQEKARYQRN